jgi:hypothetical protein
MTRDRIVSQPMDGSCFFHSVGFFTGESASGVRMRIVRWMMAHPDHRIADTTLRDWILYDSNSTVINYCKHMSRLHSWGGGIELSVLPYIYDMTVRVYTFDGKFHRVSQHKNRSRPSQNIARLLYSGNNHYDAIQAEGSGGGVVNNNRECRSRRV